MAKNKKNGFTLIELLIVIAIIGILASIVLVSLNSARNKATVAAYKSTVSSLVPGVTMCCDNSTNNLVSGGVDPAVGTDICSEPLGVTFPQAGDMKATGVAYDVNTDCDSSNPSISLDPDGLPIAACNDIIYVSTTGIFSDAVLSTSDFPSGC